MSKTSAHNPAQLKERQIALLIETESAGGRSIIRGISNYARKNALWHLLIDPRDHDHRSALPDGWQGDGVIARFTNRTQFDQVMARGLPVVNVDDVFPTGKGVGQVITDETARAALALEHLLSRGFNNLAFFAPPSLRYSTRRGEAFRKATADAGYECFEYRPGYGPGRKISWAERQRRVDRWLGSLPRPIAVLAIDAYHARQLAEICHFANIRVPDEVAILAGDSDDLLCEVATPPLSAISVASERIGYEAAGMLSNMMLGKACPKKPLAIPPHGVVSRQSTDVMSIDDPTIVQALRFIQQHAHHGIGVEGILREIPISRRSLEMQFRAYLGRSPAEEIRRVRLERGCQLLERRELSITEIALACGFSNATRFGIAFRKKYGSTPRTYRKTLFTD
jgi:LacI family transcriptional regulator